MADDAPTCRGCRDREDRIAALERRILDLERAAHRHAAPHSRGARKGDPKPPGRKDGHEGEHRGAPATVDRVLDAPLPEACPDCRGAVVEEVVRSQYVTDVPPVMPVTVRFDVHVGRCAECRRRLQGRHPGQISDALGAAAVQIGPQALAVGMEMHVRLGLSFRRVAETMGRHFGLRVSAAAFARAMGRMAGRMGGAVAAIEEALRAAAAVHGDGTGWRVDGRSACLHVVCTPNAARYLVDRRRGSGPTEEILGRDYAGVFVSDGLPAFERLPWRRQRCLAHLVRFARDVEKEKTRGAVRRPRAVKAFLRSAIDLGRRRADLGPRAFRAARRALVGRLRALLGANLSDPDNARLRGRLWGAAPHLFTFLDAPGVDPTNNEAERSLRPAVIARKLSAGNRTWSGAAAWTRLASVIETCRRNGRDFTDFAVRSLRLDADHASLALVPLTR